MKALPRCAMLAFIEGERAPGSNHSQPIFASPPFATEKPRALLGFMAATGQHRALALRVRHTRMLGPAKIYFIIFGILTIAGGIIGYVKAGSTPSIIAGSITGILLLVAAWMLPEQRVAGLAIALVVSLLLAGQFIPKFMRTGAVMPAGMMSILSAIGIVLAIVAWVKK